MKKNNFKLLMLFSIVFSVGFTNVSLASSSSANELAKDRKTIEETLINIESEHQVKCEFEKRSATFCLGQSPLETCFYSQTYICSDDNEKTFGIKLKIRNVLDFRNYERKDFVAKVIYLND